MEAKRAAKKLWMVWPDGDQMCIDVESTNGAGRWVLKLVPESETRTGFEQLMGLNEHAEVTDEWDRLAIEHRRPSCRNGMVLSVGDWVKHCGTDKKLLITSIDFWGGARDGGYRINGAYRINTQSVDAWNAAVTDDASENSESGYSSDEGCMDAECVYTPLFLNVNVDAKRTSFCERCKIDFTPEFVTCDSDFDRHNYRNWLDLYEPYRGRQRLVRSSSSCRRCEAHRPTGRVLWRFLKERLRFEAAANYWFRLAHHPRYVGTHATIAAEDMELVAQE